MTEIKYNIYGVERSVKIPEGLNNIDYSIIEPNNNDKCIKTVAIFGQKMLESNKSVKENIEWMRVINNDKIGILEGSPYILWFKNEGYKSPYLSLKYHTKIQGTEIFIHHISIWNKII